MGWVMGQLVFYLGEKLGFGSGQKIRVWIRSTNSNLLYHVYAYDDESKALESKFEMDMGPSLHVWGIKYYGSFGTLNKDNDINCNLYYWE